MATQQIIGDLFCNGEFAEFNSCPIYFDEQIIGKEYWCIQLIFFRGKDIPVPFCLRLYKGVYSGKGLLDSERNVCRISMTDPEYIVLPDTHFILTKQELNKFIGIVSDEWDYILETLNENRDCNPNLTDHINIQIPDYSLLLTQ